MVDVNATERVNTAPSEATEAKDSFTPPANVASAASRGLRLLDKTKAGTEVGWARARDLSNRRSVSLDTIGRMVSFFARHNKTRPKDIGTDADPSPWLVAWLLWGGDAGRTWANSIWDRYKKDAKEGVVFLARESVVENEALAELGLDPRWYVAAVPTELSAAGVVNKNGRIYRPDEFTQQHEALNEAARNGYVSGLKGHPMRPQLQDGDREFDIAVRLLSVETYMGDDGVLRSRGLVAFPRTTIGQDTYILWRGGLEIGTSSRGRAVFVPHTINESSPYYKSNEAYKNKQVLEVHNWQLDTYDLVLDPSAMTFLDSAAREAVARLEPCTQLPEEDTMSEKPETPAPADANRDEIVAQAVEAYRSADPFAKFDDAARSDLLAAVERVEGPVVAHLDALEAAKSDLANQLAAVTAERDALAAEKAEKERIAGLQGALESALADYPLADQIRRLVGQDIASFESADALKAKVDFCKSVFEGVTAQAAGVSRTATESVDDNGVVSPSTAKDALVDLLAGRA
jgi:hypothetical protein